MNPHDSIKSNRPGKHAAAKRDGRHQQATAETRPMKVAQAHESLSYDGCGINGCDEFRTRIATFNKRSHAEAFGPMFAAAPEMLRLLQIIVANATIQPDAAMQGTTDTYAVPLDDIEAARALIDQATGGAK